MAVVISPRLDAIRAARNQPRRRRASDRAPRLDACEAGAWMKALLRFRRLGRRGWRSRGLGLARAARRRQRDALLLGARFGLGAHLAANLVALLRRFRVLHALAEVGAFLLGEELLGLRRAAFALAPGAAPPGALRFLEGDALLLRPLLHLRAMLVAELPALLGRLRRAHLVDIGLALLRRHHLLAVDAKLALRRRRRLTLRVRRRERGCEQRGGRRGNHRVPEHAASPRKVEIACHASD